MEQYYGQQVTPAGSERPERPKEAPPMLYTDPGSATEHVPTHACIMQAERDVMAFKEQYLIRCRCHETGFKIWQPGDELGRCSGGTRYPDPRDISLRNER